MRVLLNENQLQAGVERLATEIDRYYGGDRPLTVIAVMTGSLVLFADLIRRLSMPQRVGVIQASTGREFHGACASGCRTASMVGERVRGRGLWSARSRSEPEDSSGEPNGTPLSTPLTSEVALAPGPPEYHPALLVAVQTVFARSSYTGCKLFL